VTYLYQQSWRIHDLMPVIYFRMSNSTWWDWHSETGCHF